VHVEVVGRSAKLLNDSVPPSNLDSGAHAFPGYLYDAGVVINSPTRCAATAANLLLTSIAEYNCTRYCPPLTCRKRAAQHRQCWL